MKDQVWCFFEKPTMANVVEVDKTQIPIVTGPERSPESSLIVVFPPRAYLTLLWSLLKIQPAGDNVSVSLHGISFSFCVILRVCGFSSSVELSSKVSE